GGVSSLHRRPYRSAGMSRRPAMTFVAAVRLAHIKMRARVIRWRMSFFGKPVPTFPGHALALKRRAQSLDSAVDGNLESADAHAGRLRGFLERHLAQLQELDGRALTFGERLDGMTQLLGIAIAVDGCAGVCVRDVRGILVDRNLVGCLSRVASCLIDHAIVSN